MHRSAKNIDEVTEQVISKSGFDLVASLVCLVLFLSLCFLCVRIFLIALFRGVQDEKDESS